MSASDVDRLKDEGNKYVSNKKFAAAIDAYSRAIAIDNKNRVLWGNRSAAHLSLNKIEEAVSDAQKCVEVDPTWSKGYYRLGAAEEHRKCHTAAAEAYSKALALDSSNSDLQACVARCRMQAKAAAPPPARRPEKRRPTLQECLASALSVIDLPSLPRTPALADLATAFPSVRIEERPGKGRCLVATRSMPALSLLFQEPAVCWYPQLGDELGATIPGLLETSGSLEHTYGILLQLAPWASESALDSQPVLRTFTSAPMRAVDFLLPVLKANVLGCMFDEDAPSDRSRVCIIAPVADMMNHSCSPNVGRVGVWDADSASPALRVFTERAVCEGEELCIAYAPRDAPRQGRRDGLRKQYGFTCSCERCTAPHDDTVVFCCTACTHGRIYLRATACADCGAAVDPALTQLRGAWDLAREKRVQVRTREDPLSSGAVLSPSGTAGQGPFPGLHPSDTYRHDYMRSCLGEAWSAMHAAGQGTHGQGERAVYTPGKVCELTALVADTPMAALLGPVALLDSLLFAGNVHAVAGQKEKAKAFFKRAASIAEMTTGRHSPNAIHARAFAERPPKDRLAVETAEGRRLRDSTTWAAAYGMPRTNATRWVDPIDKQSEQATGHAAGFAKELTDLTVQAQALGRSFQDQLLAA